MVALQTTLQAEFKEATVTLEATRGELEAAKSSLQDERSHAAQLSDKSARLSQRLAAVQTEKDKLAAELIRLEAQNDDLTASIAASVDEILREPEISLQIRVVRRDLHQ